MILFISNLRFVSSGFSSNLFNQPITPRELESELRARTRRCGADLRAESLEGACCEEKNRDEKERVLNHRCAADLVDDLVHGILRFLFWLRLKSPPGCGVC